MGLFALLNHLINLLAPALVVGPLLAVVAPLVQKKAALRHSWLWHSVLNVLAGVLALLAGLWFFGHDGKMASYMAMLVCCATAQFAAVKGWRT
jgi:uncharacterized membrane protein HdeD (DUF308 family)